MKSKIDKLHDYCFTLIKNIYFSIVGCYVVSLLDSMVQICFILLKFWAKLKKKIKFQNFVWYKSTFCLFSNLMFKYFKDWEKQQQEQQKTPEMLSVSLF